MLPSCPLAAWSAPPSRCHCRRSFRRSAPRSAVSPLAERLRLRLTLSCPALRKLAVDVLSRCDRSVVSASSPPRAASGQRSSVARSPPRCDDRLAVSRVAMRSEEHTSALQSLMRRSYAVICLKKKNNEHTTQPITHHNKRLIHE